MSVIQYYNRYTGQEEEEVVYGESYLRWTYETKLGRLGLWLLAKRSFFSRWYGWRMNRPASARMIRPFIDRYGLKEDEFAEPTDSYSHFNDFFYRKLKASARPLEAGDGDLAFPADARHLGVPDVSATQGLFVKGQTFDLEGLLGDVSLADHYRGGAAVVSRLCPVDYHRYHSPVTGTISQQRLINGPLYSVSPIALRRSMGYLWENKRVLSLLDTEAFGQVAFVAIGATCVGSVNMTAGEGDAVSVGDELGYFAFGGSCVVTLLPKGSARLSDDLRECGSRHLEVYAHVRDKMGEREK